MQQNQTNQDFLTMAVQSDLTSEDQDVQKLVRLHYQQAILETLWEFQPCAACAEVDLTLLKKRVQKLSSTTRNSINTLAVLPMQRVQQLITESRTLLGDIAQLCPACLQRIQQTVPLAFSRIHSTPK